MQRSDCHQKASKRLFSRFVAKYLLGGKGSKASTDNSQPEQRAFANAPRSLDRSFLIPPVEAVDRDVDEKINEKECQLCRLVHSCGR